MSNLEHFKHMIDRLRELERGKLNLSKETLRDLDQFFREQILYTDELTDRERGVVIEYYLRSA